MVALSGAIAEIVTSEPMVMDPALPSRFCKLILPPVADSVELLATRNVPVPATAVSEPPAALVPVVILPRLRPALTAPALNPLLCAVTLKLPAADPEIGPRIAF